MNKDKALKIIKDAYIRLAPIPEANWMVGEFTDGVSRCCVNGHWQRLNSANPENYNQDLSDWDDSYQKRGGLRIAAGFFGYSIVSINNDEDLNFPQRTSKQRAITCLKEILVSNSIDIPL